MEEMRTTERNRDHSGTATRRLILAVLGGLVVGLGVSAAAARPARQVSRLVVFGDSLSDTGNVFILTFGFIPGPPYFEGHFSNGPVWVEHIAHRLEVPAPTPSEAGGTNYAHGGAETGPGFSNLLIPNMATQIADYLSRGPAPESGDLFVLLGGANDFFNGELNPAGVVANLIDHVGTLSAAGATQFLLLNLPRLGQTPDALGTPDEALFDQLTGEFNALYDQALEELEAERSATIYRFDTAGLLEQILSRRSAFGLTNVTEPAYDEGSGTIVRNPDEYLYWDGIHPSTVGHRIVADHVVDMLAAFAADVTGDGFVDVQDLVEVILQWGACPSVCPADVDGDGAVGVSDLVAVILNWD